ncbi:Hypothetical predicted protein [Pelobates cultripes]|uniref:Uncharacterized protein n=1 Tax=Pelobates cultripes TaxID=61616 RepID=A0AAD1TJ62_PELCU|nr:Hypothetical predicted protein [Pelobates cultripes]
MNDPPRMTNTTTTDGRDIGDTSDVDKRITRNTGNTGKPPRQRRDNLSKEEHIALKDLMQDPTIIIRPADKGGAVVIQTYVDYRNEIMRQLNDESTYRRLTFDPVSKFQRMIDNLLNWDCHVGT